MIWKDFGDGSYYVNSEGDLMYREGDSKYDAKMCLSPRYSEKKLLETKIAKVNNLEYYFHLDLTRKPVTDDDAWYFRLELI